MIGSSWISVSVEGTRAAQWDKDTWPELERLAKHHPEAGVHFQGWMQDLTMVEGFGLADWEILEEYQFNRKRDVESATGRWLAGALSSEPWFKDVVPNV